MNRHFSWVILAGLLFVVVEMSMRIVFGGKLGVASWAPFLEAIVPDLLATGVDGDTELNALPESEPREFNEHIGQGWGFSDMGSMHSDPDTSADGVIRYKAWPDRWVYKGKPLYAKSVDSTAPDYDAAGNAFWQSEVPKFDLTVFHFEARFPKGSIPVCSVSVRLDDVDHMVLTLNGKQEGELLHMTRGAVTRQDSVLGPVWLHLRYVGSHWYGYHLKLPRLGIDRKMMGYHRSTYRFTFLPRD